MKHAFGSIVGKRIKGVVVKEADSPPTCQVFLVFSDDTHYELYTPSGDIRGTGGVDEGGFEHVKKYMSSHSRIVFEYCEDGGG